MRGLLGNRGLAIRNNLIQCSSRSPAPQVPASTETPLSSVHSQPFTAKRFGSTAVRNVSDFAREWKIGGIPSMRQWIGESQRRLSFPIRRDEPRGPNSPNQVFQVKLT